MAGPVNSAVRPRRRWQAGVTLIELLVVIGVLATLSAIVTVNVLFITNSGKAAAACTDQKTIQTAVAAYFNDIGKYPMSTANTGGASGDATATTAAPPHDFVNIDELLAPPAPATSSYIHTQPDYANDGAFTYSDTNGSVVAADASGC